MIQFLPPPSKNLKRNNKSEGCFVFLPSEGKARGAEERGSGSRRFPPRMLSAALGLPIALFPRKKWGKKRSFHSCHPYHGHGRARGFLSGRAALGHPGPMSPGPGVARGSLRTGHAAGDPVGTAAGKSCLHPPFIVCGFPTSISGAGGGEELGGSHPGIGTNFPEEKAVP